jgi:hypothetical protein
MDEFRSAAEQMTFEADSVIDVRAMQQVNRQISLAVSAVSGGCEEYFVPVEIGGEVTKVRISFRDSDDGASSADIRFKTPSGSENMAHFEILDGNAEGYMITDSDEDVKKMAAAADIFTAELNSRGLQVAEIRIFTAGEGDHPGTYVNAGRDAGADRREGAGRKELFGISRDFLKAVKESFYEDQL